MRTYTAHLRAGRAPVLVAERFSWGAAILGVWWLLACRAWIAAAIVLALQLCIGFAPGSWRFWLGCALFLLQGAFGQDLRRWTLRRRGFALAHVVAARDRDAAWVRLLEARPDLQDVAGR